jgi:hypothetical protein
MSSWTAASKVTACSFLPRLKDQHCPDGVLDVDAIAESDRLSHHRSRSVRTMELDVRPWSENFFGRLKSQQKSSLRRPQREWDSSHWK